MTARDESNNLALLKVTVTWCHSASPRRQRYAVQIGETVYVAGNPQGFEGTVLRTVLSAVGAMASTKKERLQMTDSISPGNSGGTVLNRNGEVIGSVHVSLQPAFRKINQTSNLAVPSNALQAVAGSVRGGKTRMQTRLFQILRT